MKKLKIAALLALGSLTSLSAQANTWNTVEATLAGTSPDGTTTLKLEYVSGSTSFETRFFKVRPEIGDLALAIGLAAVSSNRQLVIQSTIDEVDNSTHPIVNQIFLSKATTTLN